MDGEPTNRPAEDFEEHRPLLFSIAYRMLGSVVEAEDVVQEAYLRWRTAHEVARSPKAYLSTVVTRLSIDRLRMEKARREEYVGPWLPEPLLADPTHDADASEPLGAVALDESLSMAFLVLLESLNPTERAVFLLREVFGCGYDQVAHIIGKSEQNCRQIAHRARSSVASRRPRFESSREEGERLQGGFLEACASGEIESLLSLLSEDVTLYSDGGGRVAAARKPIHGAQDVARFVLGLVSKAPPDFVALPARVGSEPALVGYVGGIPLNVLAFEVSEGRINAIRIVVNPEKLLTVPPLPGNQGKGAV